MSGRERLHRACKGKRRRSESVPSSKVSRSSRSPDSGVGVASGKGITSVRGASTESGLASSIVGSVVEGIGSEFVSPCNQDLC